MRITSVGVDDPLGYVISVIMIVFSILALWLAARVMKGKDYATLQKGGGALQKRRLSKWEALLAYGWIALVLAVVLAPHVGILLMSLAQVWSFSVLPDSYTLAHYATVFSDARSMMANTLLYCVLAAGLDALGDLDGLDDDAVTAKLEAVQAEPFFRLVHSTTVVTLYDDHEVWQLLGYEGSSFEKGGYLHRGFDDLDWLPEVRIEEYDGEPRVEIVKGA